MKLQVLSKTITDGEKVWKASLDGTWQIRVFGTTHTKRHMHWSWNSLPANKVPDEVKQLATDVVRGL